MNSVFESFPLQLRNHFLQNYQSFLLEQFRHSFYANQSFSLQLFNYSICNYSITPFTTIQSFPLQLLKHSLYNDSNFLVTSIQTFPSQLFPNYSNIYPLQLFKHPLQLKHSLYNDSVILLQLFNDSLTFSAVDSYLTKHRVEFIPLRLKEKFMHCVNVYNSKQTLNFERFSCCKKEYGMLETMHLTSLKL